MPGAGTQPVIDRFAYEMPTPGPGQSLPGTGTQPNADPDISGTRYWDTASDRPVHGLSARHAKPGA